MITVFDNKIDCCGCTACKHICPTKAITMEKDVEGFLYPKINQELCIDCGLCKKVCAFQNGYDKSRNLEVPFVYAAKHMDEKVRMSSTSGGAFTAISDYVLDKGGVVYGAAFDEDMNVVHQIASTKNERDKFKGSKYVQSDLKNTFSEIKSLLEYQKYVLFTGTPCQTAGLKSFLVGVNIDKLLLCDIVCHGTPSPLIWKEHIIHVENKSKRTISGYNFRDKLIGWRGINATIRFSEKELKNSYLARTYANLYFSHNITRPACHNCKYTNLARSSDITIADFWGIENCMPEFDDNKGTSLILINTLKGIDLFDRIKENLVYRESNTQDCLQPQLQYPTKPSAQRDKFWEDYWLNGYGYVVKKYAGYNLKSKVKEFVKLTLSKLGILNNVKKLLR